MKVAYGADGVENPALGARGGLPGGASKHFKRERDGRLTDLPPQAFVELAEGERIVSITAGGGGYGPPAERDPERVRHDVAEGWVTPRARARGLSRGAHAQPARGRGATPTSRDLALDPPRRIGYVRVVRAVNMCAHRA